MEISRFEDLLTAARAQPQPQRLLFVFAAVEMPDDATADQRAGFARGEGGALVPQMCVDKAPDELNTFADLAEEAQQFGKPWASCLPLRCRAARALRPPAPMPTSRWS